METTWILVAALIIVALIVVFKSQDLVFIFMLIKKYLFFFLASAVIVYLVFSLVNLHNTQNVDLTSFSGIVQATKIYWSWFKGILANVVEATGHVVNQDWGLNDTNLTLK